MIVRLESSVRRMRSLNGTYFDSGGRREACHHNEPHSQRTTYLIPDPSFPLNTLSNIPFDVNSVSLASR